MLATMLLAAACSSDGYGEYNGSADDARAEIASAKDKLFAESNSHIVYSYMVNSEVNGEKYELGQRNIFKFNKDAEAGISDINRFNYYYGSNQTVSDTFYYTDGALYTEMYNTVYRVPMTEAEFLEYTDGTDYAVDRDFFNLKSFSEVSLFEKDGNRSIKLKADDGTFSRRIADFLGFDIEEYTFSFDNMEYLATVNGNGCLIEEKITFEVEYSLVTDPSRVILYTGEFSCKAEQIGGVKLNQPVTENGVTEESDISLLDSFADKAFGVLSTFTTLDAEYDRYIKISDDTTEYIIRNYVHFTEAYRDETYTYGSLDTRFYRTPDELNSVKNGIFIDSDGYHYRATDGDGNDFEEKPYSDMEMLAMVFDTLSAERPPEEDICKPEIQIDDEYITYTYTYTDEATRYYGEYLLEYFSEDGSEVSLNGTKVQINESKSVIKVRRSDGCIVLHTVVYDAVFGEKINVQCEFKMNVNATGDDVNVMTLADWETAKGES